MTPPAPPGPRFFGLLGLGLLAVCAAYAALVLRSSTWAEARQLESIFPFYHWQARAFTPADLSVAVRTLTGLATLLALGATALAVSPAGRMEAITWHQELRGAGASLGQALAQLPPRQRHLAASALGGLTALRLGLSWPAVVPEYDDAASYVLFASKSLLAVSAYYPLPNNHVFSNTLSWLFYQLNPDFWWTMRLPVVLAATTGTALLFAGLLRVQVGFRPALMAAALFSLAQLGLYHAVVGRGYWLAAGLAGVVFFSVVALGENTARARAAWSALALGSILGAFTVPTFALVLASGFSWLGLRCLRRADGPMAGRVVATAVLVAGGGLLLYAPLLFVSGPAALFSNGFVSPLALPKFLAAGPAYLWQTEGRLAGQVVVGAFLTVAGLAGAAVLHERARAGRLPAARARPWLRLAPAALWFGALPYAVLATQRVLAPERTLFYKAFFFFLLLALVLDWLLHLRPRVQRWLRPVLWLLGTVWGGYQLSSVLRDARTIRQHNQAFHAAFQWLMAQPRQLVLVPEPSQSIFMRLYLSSERPGQPWQFVPRPRPGTHYPYVMAFPGQRGYFQPKFSYAPAFHNAEVDIYRVPTPAPGPLPAVPFYWYLHEKPKR